MTQHDDERPIELDALAPEPARFEALLAATLVRADSALAARSASPIEVIASWSRPLLAAAALIVALLVPVELLLERRDTHVERVERLVTLSVHGARGVAATPPTDILRALSRTERP